MECLGGSGVLGAVECLGGSGVLGAVECRGGSGVSGGQWSVGGSGVSGGQWRVVIVSLGPGGGGGKHVDMSDGRDFGRALSE